MRPDKKAFLHKFIQSFAKHPVMFIALPVLVVFFAAIALFKTPSADAETGDAPTEVEADIFEPLVYRYDNAYVTDADYKGVTILYEDETLYFPYEKYCEREENLKDSLADILVTDGEITDTHVKNTRIHGKLLKADRDGIELEEDGYFPFGADPQMYSLLDGEAVCCGRELLGYGYDLSDFIIEDGYICGALRVREAPMRDIRVLIKASDYDGLLHDTIELTCDSAFTLQYASETGVACENYEAGEVLTFSPGSAYLHYGSAIVIPSEEGCVVAKSVNRKLGTPKYKGSVEIREAEGKLSLVNEVSLEQYLYSVIPSEMPASYPAEALKVQAVCARTYAYGHMLKASYPRFGAHLDDSASYQVYNNNDTDKRTDLAVDETAGMILFTDKDKPAETYYYSTSAGVGTRADIWKSPDEIPDYLKAKRLSRNAVQAKTKDDPEKEAFDLMQEENFAAFIGDSDKDDYEANDGWYRWTYTVDRIDTDLLYRNLVKNYEKNAEYVLTKVGSDFESREIEAFSKVTDLQIVKRCMGGSADELLVVTDGGTYKVITEGMIRSVLCDGETKVVRRDGSKVAMPKLLPSAFFIIETNTDGERLFGYRLIGGGFGHGIGMSQNGARYMAGEGLTAEQILAFFYDGCKLRDYADW